MPILWDIGKQCRPRFDAAEGSLIRVYPVLLSECRIKWTTYIEKLSDIFYDIFHEFFPFLRGYCNRLRPSIHPLCYLLLNHWTKFNKMWCVSYSHEWGMQPQDFFWSRPLGRGQKVKYHLISVTKSFSKIFYTKLCLCSHK